jgi:hypothetical protein
MVESHIKGLWELEMMFVDGICNYGYSLRNNSQDSIFHALFSLCMIFHNRKV